ncbi:hypothetical protein MIND_01024900 [Mycena indigotica]|uniref:Proteasome assembly chaperone 3 n=1 Tax=Mycena indigotica TaxID=2126181 RepID=A0A8H6S9X9_9AGAR|nr:uncharacterized protein MIND_01024900 [Mycena indigotica]KAF7294870.1 hypothetical protein MIND_01024900 [Mycena indigotica]
MTRQLTRQLEGVQTEVVIQRFVDRVLVLVTQLGKVGNLIQATIPETTPLAPPATADELPEPSPAIQLTPLLGQGPSQHMQTLHSLYAAQIATIIWTASSNPLDVTRKSVVVGIALQRTSSDDENLTAHERNVFGGVMKMILELV